MFTFNPDGFIIFDQQLWDLLLTALDKGAPPPGTPRPKKKSCPSLSCGAANLTRKTLAITRAFFADEERMEYALRVGTSRSLQDAQMVLDNPFFADDN